MKLNLKYRIMAMALTAVAMMIPGSALAKREKLVTVDNISASSVLGQQDGGPGELNFYPNYLLDGKVETQFHTMDEDFLKEKQYIQITFGDANPLKLDDEEYLELIIQRCEHCDDRQPTKFSVKGKVLGEDTYSDVVNVSIDFTVPAKTDKARLDFPTDKAYTELRFYVEESSKDKKNPENGYYSMGMAEFQIEKVSGEYAVRSLVNKDNISAADQLGDMSPKYLVDNDLGTQYHTPDDAPNINIGEQYLQVDFTDGLKLGANEDLVAYLQRCPKCYVRQPTVFEVKGSKDGTNYEHVCYLYFLYRGYETKEYSARFKPTEEYTSLRFYVLENNSRNKDAADHRGMGLAEFQLYAVNRKGEYPDGMRDAFHLSTDYKTDYYNDTFKFTPTMGWLDTANRDEEATTDNLPSRYVGNLNHEAYNKGTLEDHDGSYVEGGYNVENPPKHWEGQRSYVKKINEWANWGADWSADGKWTLDAKFLKEHKITMPDMGMITKDKDIAPRNENLADYKVQPTHVTEHILYAIPGDPIVLYPYYKFAAPLHYEEYEVNFAHWYDYRTGGRIFYDYKNGNAGDLLDFVVDPSQICITEKNGFFGGYLLTEKDGNLPDRHSQNFGMYATFFCPRDPYNKDGSLQNLPFRDEDKAQSGLDNDVDEYVIAADFSQSFNKGRNLKNNEIIEPDIAFRHIFRIRDGKKFADDFSGSADLNKEYTKRNRRQVMARAGHEFQIGLDGGVPRPAKNTEHNEDWVSVPSKYYYKISESEYRRINSMAIRVLDEKGTQVAIYTHKNGNLDDEGHLFYFDGEEFNDNGRALYPMFDGLGSRKLKHGDKDVVYSTGGGNPTNTDQSKYWRLLKTKNTQLKGKYIVQILGEEIIGGGTPQLINVYGSQDEPLVVMEYVIDFVDDEDKPNPKAIFVPAGKLYGGEGLTAQKNLESFREEDLIDRFGAAKDKIDFDQYRYLETLTENDRYKQYLDKDEKGNARFKWPASWEKSNYGFGYSEGHNYNMYVVANNSWKVPYHDMWEGENDLGQFDRLYYNTQRKNGAGKEEKGYFLYVNAADDPGVMMTLNADRICTGSSINVSAWICGFTNFYDRSNVELPNIAFNLVAVLENTGERIPIHTFVSGYMDRKYNGQWHKIHYSFMPDVDEIGYDSKAIDHYEIELENNCKVSAGGDYAIDDIAVYIVSPQLAVTQNSPVCLPGAFADKTFTVSAPFNETLSSIDEDESETDNTPLDLYYVILDKDKFEKAMKEGDQNDGHLAEKVFESKVAQIGEQHKLTLNTKFDANDGQNGNLKGSMAGGVKMCSFEVDLSEDEDFRDNKKYWIAVFVQNPNTTNPVVEPGWLQYDTYDPCTKAAEFSVQSVNKVHVEGELRDPGNQGGIKVCEGTAPTVSIDIYSIPEKDETADNDATEDNMEEGEQTKEEAQKYQSRAYCDWYYGNEQDYNKEEGLAKAMAYFREYYPTAKAPTEEEGVVVKDRFTSEMLSLLQSKAVSPDVKEDLEGKIVFYQNKFTFPVLTVKEETETGEDGETITTKKTIASAYAIPIPFTEEEEGNIVCTAPKLIELEVLKKAPTALHGIRDIDYDPAMTNVPIRIGLKQLDMVKEANDAQLNIPLRKVEGSGIVADITNLEVNENEPIYLISTTDPAYAPEGSAEDAEEYTDLDEEAGKITLFQAVADGETGATDNHLTVEFKDDFKFREGFEYTFSYSFRDQAPEVTAEEGEEPIEDEEVSVCSGENKFTIKVVPEYLIWNGDGEEGERNWNSDDNWLRVSSKDLNAGSKTGDLAAHLYDGLDGEKEVNNNKKAFTPMDFTKVIIPASADHAAPILYDLKKDEAKKWSSDLVTNQPEAAGEATTNINYDMTAYVAQAAEGETAEVKCSAWVGNTCGQIHFMTDSEILGQGYLEYDRAWIDMKVDSSRWYTLASPLKEVFAGEFYLPKDNGVQSTQLFEEITFDPKKNDRFSPAVFQRGWDKSSASTYTADGKTETAVVKANWSHVYNDVQEKYGEGLGFSLKTDVSHFEGDDVPTSVVFRLPKADDSYTYYHSDQSTDYKDADGNKKDEFSHGITRSNHYKLNDDEGTITATTAGSGYFLVGNPFMAHLDMAKFLKENEGKIEPKFWMITSGAQKMGIFDESLEDFAGDASGKIAPMQGFFVKAVETRADLKTIELAYTKEMAVEGSFDAESGEPLKVATRSESGNGTISISAVNDGRISTTAIVKLSQDSKAIYMENEDVTVLDNSDLDVAATVYTVSDGKALSINSLPELSRIELGLIALSEEETVLQFHTDGEVETYLYDSADGSYTPVSEGMEYSVKGNVAGRLYLTAGLPGQIAESAISFKKAGNEVTVKCPETDETLSVRVYDYNGRIIYDFSDEEQEVTFTLSSGVYIIEASAGDDRACRQIII